jgi:hypothetical protein
MSGVWKEEALQVIQGLPTLRFDMPDTEIGSMSSLIPGIGYVNASVSFRGNMAVSFPRSDPRIAIDVWEPSLRLEARNTLDGLFQGVRITGIGTPDVALAATGGTQYWIVAVTLPDPKNPLTTAISGQVRAPKAVPSKLGEMKLTMQVGFEMRITIVPRPPVPDTEDQIDKQVDWKQVGLVVLALLLALPTEGQSLKLLPE